MRRNVWYLVITIVVVFTSLGATLASGNSPILGLDLQGGISVVLAPVGRTTAGTLDVAKDIIDNRVNSLGVAEPEISRQGNNIVVDLPGVKDRNKAERLVGQTAELRFRPVLGILPASATKSTTTTTSKKSENDSSTTSSGASTSSTAAATSTSSGSGGGKTRALQASPTTAAATTAPPASSPTAASTPASTPLPTDASTPAPPTDSQIKITPRSKDKADAAVILPDKEGTAVYSLGPVPKDLGGKAISTARARLDPSTSTWVVELKLKPSGADAFNALAAESFPKQPPQNAVAIVLDSQVISAPAFQTANFQGGQVEISGGSESPFSQTDATDLARVLRFGALPVALKKLTTQNVSPTLGKDQLNAGIAAGIIGLALVALYMLIYYRVLGLVVISGLVVTAAAIYSLVTYLGQSIGLTLTLAGVTGLIVSVGITVDSYVVYFERLKDEVRSGKTVRSSVDRGFQRSFSTILAADLVSLLGAGVLYFLALGSVRGFAFFLGLSTLLDLVISYFFMHPVVSLMARRPGLVRNRFFGIARGLDVSEATT